MNLEELRKAIDAVDHDMMELFKKRMELSYMVGEYKKLNHLQILDSSREKELLKNRREELGDDSLWPYYEAFIKEIMKLSKEYQK
ncbi:MAG: chorismate mutase [Acholeplasmataceae bacterium]|nr:chorismate mutase [Acholeplasmataceae bacterium]